MARVDYFSGFRRPDCGLAGMIGRLGSRIVILVGQHLESTLDSVDFAEERSVALAQQLGLPEEDTFRLGYAVREAMVNAVVHGNGYSANKQVHLVIGHFGNTMELTIEDEGEGFNAGGQADPLATENLLNQSGRGITLIRAFVDEFEIGRAGPKGTRVVLRKKLPAQP